MTIYFFSSVVPGHFTTETIKGLHVYFHGTAMSRFSFKIVFKSHVGWSKKNAIVRLDSIFFNNEQLQSKLNMIDKAQGLI